MECLDRRRKVKWRTRPSPPTGIGAYIAEATETGDFPRVVLGIAVMCILVTLFNRLLWRPLYAFAERRLRLCCIEEKVACSISHPDQPARHPQRLPVFPKGSGEGLLVLEEVDLTTMPAKSSALLGRSGSGKSTLLRIIAGLIAPSSGSVGAGARPSGSAEGVAMVFQTFALFPWLTVLQNVELGLGALGIAARAPQAGAGGDRPDRPRRL